MQSYLISAQQNRLSDRLRVTMKSRIDAALQAKLSERTDVASQRRFLYIANLAETKLINMTTSEEEYLNLRDLDIRINAILGELIRTSSQQHAMSASHGISALPDALISQILVRLPTKDSVKTSVLSTRWRNLWLNVPGLDLHSADFDWFSKSAIKYFIDGFLEFNRQCRMDKFKIKYDKCNVYLSDIRDLIARVINRGVQHLDVDPFGCPMTKDYMPLEIYKSKTLVSLKLVNVGMLSPRFIFSLPCLKIMHLEDMVYSVEDPLILENLITSCPVLEDLTLCRDFDDNVPILRVRSRSLKRFWVRFPRAWRIGGIEYAVEIDAPRLMYMNFRDNQSDSVVAKNIASLFTMDIDTNFNVRLDSTLQTKKDAIRGFLNGISSVRHMIISRPTLEVLYRNLKLGNISKFHALSRLEASFCTLLLRVLPDFLGGFPNLKHLTLYLVYMKELEPENLELRIVPQCLLSTLESVEIKEVFTKETGLKRKRNNMKVLKHKKKMWMEVLRYILENSLFLKNLSLCFSPITYQDISKELLALTKRYSRCEVIHYMPISSNTSV